MDSQASLDIFGSPSLSSSANMTGPNAHCVRYAPFVFPRCLFANLAFSSCQLLTSALQMVKRTFPNLLTACVKQMSWLRILLSKPFYLPRLHAQVKALPIFLTFRFLILVNTLHLTLSRREGGEWFNTKTLTVTIDGGRWESSITGSKGALGVSPWFGWGKEINSYVLWKRGGTDCLIVV